jgi:hypothetical protein
MPYELGERNERDWLATLDGFDLCWETQSDICGTLLELAWNLSKGVPQLSN